MSTGTLVSPMATVSANPAPVRSRITVVGHKVTLTGYLVGQVFTPDNKRLVVTTTDDSTNFNTSVAVVSTATASQVGHTTKLVGIADEAPLLAAGGTRAVITAHVGGDVSVAVVDTITGLQVGTTIVMSGSRQPTRLCANGTRAIVTTTSSDLVNGGTRVAVIDVNDGAQVGSTLVLPGDQSATWSTNGTRALVTTIDGDWGTGVTTRISVIDTDTVAQIGSTLSLAGRLVDPPLASADGSHFLIAADDGSTSVAVISLATGAQEGSTLVIPGRAPWVGETPDGDRALIAAAANDSSTNVALIDISNGTQIGTTLAVPGSVSGAPVQTDATHALLVTQFAPDYTKLDTRVTVIDTRTGAVTGSPTTIAGGLIQTPLLSADGARALIVTSETTVIVDTATGGQAGPAVDHTGLVEGFEMAGADRTRAVVANVSAGGTSYTTGVSVIDTLNGGHVGATLTLSGYLSAPPLVNADGSRALIVTTLVKPIAVFGDPFSTRVAVIDTATGKQAGSSRTFTGGPEGVQRLSADGRYVLISTSPFDPFTHIRTTKLMVVDLLTGKQVGTTRSLSGGESVEPLFTSDGTAAAVVTYTYLKRKHSVTSKVAILRIA